MKRARVDEDFNPVYPYDPPYAPIMPFITPPFTSSDGLQEKPFGVLSINYKDPITTQNGSLTLKVGNGLSINNQGQLTSTQTTVTPPLTNESDTLGLAYSDPLTVKNNSLTLSHSAPFAVSNHSLSLKTTTPFFINQQNELALSTDAPLQVTAGSLRLQSAAPLGIAEQTLRLLFSNPLFLQDNFLTLAIERPLAITSSGNLTVQLNPPFQSTSTGLALSLSNPLTISNGTLAMSIKRPFIIDDNKLYMDFRPPLRLFNSEPQLGVHFNPPITVQQGGLALNTGDGLQVYLNKLTLNIGRDLQYENGSLVVKLTPAPPLQYTTQLQLNMGAGLHLGATKQLTLDVDTNRGLTWNNNKLAVNLGDGLQFNSYGQIIPTVKKDTLWTTADPSPNCSIYKDLDAKLWLSLVKSGGMVHGSIALQALKDTLLSPTDSFITIILYFDENGVRAPYPTFDNEGTLAKDATWGYRQGPSADTNVTNALEFMPSSARYPRGKHEQAQNQTFGYTCLQGNFSWPIPFRVQYNYVRTGFSFKFTWQVVNRQKFDIPCCSFSYITEQ
ncbi:long fiber [Rhesus adenovirus 59]|nr:long fiber [Rhesus adenovirus 55]AUG71717.1 long fiber [Rhesus adenovirus 59]AUG71900.1 long fiber [Rhesus adenovirus 67]